MFAEKYLKHLESITGRKQDHIGEIESRNELPNVFVFIYNNWPEKGLFTGFTFGLSATTHESWAEKRVELMITVNSSEDSWPFSIGYIAEKLRGEHPFSYGSIIDFSTNISVESELNAYLISAPSFLTTEQETVPLGSFECALHGIYPIYLSEAEVIEELGLDGFRKLESWDPINIKRENIVIPK